MTKISVTLRNHFPLEWKMRREYRLPNADPKQAYYIGWSPRRQGWTRDKLDSAGVIMHDGIYHPVNIAQYGLHEYGLALRGDEPAFQRFLAQAKFLATHQNSDGAYIYSNPLPNFSAGPNWISAMAQGEACSLLVRAFATTGDDAYAAAAMRAANPLRRDARQGGASFIRGGDVFFEEVAVDKPCHILNGHLYAAFGLWDLARFGLADRELLDLHAAGIATLESWLPEFDADGWSYYHLGVDGRGKRELATPGYHQFHIAQLNVYAEMTGKDLFRTTAQRWKAALDDPSVRRRVWNNGLYRIAHAVAHRMMLTKRIVWKSSHPDDNAESLAEATRT